MKLNEINIRDPYILPYDGKYYMYGTRVKITEAYPTRWGEQHGFDVYISEDLENWSSPKAVFERNPDFWGEEEFWAPEVYLYNGKFYMFATFKAEGKCMATHILVSDAPDGTFVPVSKEPVTPPDWVCLDGTLYVDQQGQPHMVFCHEWKQIGDGTVCEIALSADLSCPISSPRLLWSASDYKAVRTVRQGQTCYVTDGPFLHRCADGTLLCIWSSFNDNGYAELVSISDNGDIDGNWRVCQEPISPEIGGHGMLFRDFEGNLQFVMHSPNAKTLERPKITPVTEENGMLRIQ
ncbi:MAG: family 43 glycosylhydrolase [Oscillospiraceae bacterium]|nr:family 43 glycosylhydrolase [Oscillospiraceae bacterium]